MRAAGRAFASAALWLNLCLGAAALALCPAAARADMAGTAEGALNLDDSPTALVHAYVVEEIEIPEMQFGDGPARTYNVLLTDRPFPEGFKPSGMAAHHLSFEGRLRGVGFEVDPETGAVMSGRTLLPAAEGPQFFTVIAMGTEPMVVLENWAEAGDRLRGHVRTPEPLEVVNFDGDPNLPAAFTFAATFDAAILRAPKLVETLEGDAARSSAQLSGLRRFIDAIAARDLEAIKAAVAAGDPMAEALTAEDVEMMNAMMFDSAENTDGVLANLSKVYVFDNGSAVVVLQHGEGGTTTFPLRDDGGTWKMGQP